MQKLEIGQWEIEYDLSKTLSAYQHLTNERCHCDNCLNYYLATARFPIEVKLFFEKLGIDITKPTEIYDNGVFENGCVLYGGFYHIVGKCVRGSNVWEKQSNQNDNDSQVYSLTDDMAKITAGFEVGFTNDISLKDDAFPEQVCQMEILFWVNWVMEKPY